MAFRILSSLARACLFVSRSRSVKVLPFYTLKIGGDAEICAVFQFLAYLCSIISTCCGLKIFSIRLTACRYLLHLHQRLEISSCLSLYPSFRTNSCKVFMIAQRYEQDVRWGHDGRETDDAMCLVARLCPIIVLLQNRPIKRLSRPSCHC